MDLVMKRSKKCLSSIISEISSLSFFLFLDMYSTDFWQTLNFIEKCIDNDLFKYESSKINLAYIIFDLP